jgi:hypothetical protein
MILVIGEYRFQVDEALRRKKAAMERDDLILISVDDQRRHPRSTRSPTTAHDREDFFLDVSLLHYTFEKSS